MVAGSGAIRAGVRRAAVRRGHAARAARRRAGRQVPDTLLHVTGVRAPDPAHAGGGPGAAAVAASGRQTPLARAAHCWDASGLIDGFVRLLPLPAPAAAARRAARRRAAAHAGAARPARAPRARGGARGEVRPHLRDLPPSRGQAAAEEQRKKQPH
ncbi:hypothetical protein JYU34_022003 [Plutella xylostella]|uniref:Uncharacterized protein n=1 Tax=Plutella xylostella TaxID=51655 RepID=A0ABQ7PRW7_PLUXY|nr:hypothetical protein JYU34_022003 [Plutella xylostella]